MPHPPLSRFPGKGRGPGATVAVTMRNGSQPSPFDWAPAFAGDAQKGW